MSTTLPRLLVAGGHDPSGAGVDADLDALRGLPLEVATVVTAWTVQDSGGVRALGARPATEWAAEARAAAGLSGGLDAGAMSKRLDRPAALKFGLLPGADHVRAAARLVRELGAPAVVVDPVLAASSGGRFLDAAGVAALRQELLALPVVATPNVAELAELADADPRELAVSLPARRAAALLLLERGCAAVVAKAGHGMEEPACDLVVCRPRTSFAEAQTLVLELRHPRIPGAKIRGSGCRFATRLAAGLALGQDLATAARGASALLEELLSASRRP